MAESFSRPGDAGKEDVRRFLKEIPGLKAPGERNNADAVLQVSILANRGLYEDLRRRENLMYEALEDLMKDVIEERVSEAVSQAVSKAVSEAVKLNTEQVTEQVTERVTEQVAEQKDKEMAVKLFGRGMSMDTIAELVGRSVDVVLQWISPASQA